MFNGNSFRRQDPQGSSTSHADPSRFTEGPPPTHAGPQSRAEFDALSEAFIRCYPAALRSAQGTLEESLPRGFNGEVLEGEAAFDYMVTLRQRIADAATDIAGWYDSATWLHLIRRLSPHALGFVETGTTDHEGDALQRVAENLVGTAQGLPPRLNYEAVPTDVAMRLARLMALVRMVDELEGAIRCSTKGVKYKVARHHRPRPHDSNSLLDALHEFDIRNTWGSADDAARLDVINVDDFEHDPPMLVAYRFHHGVAMDQVWDGPFSAGRVREEAVQFTIRAFTTADETYTTLGRRGVLESFENPEAIAALVVFGHALLRYVLGSAASAGQSLPHFGILEIDTANLLRQIEMTLEQPKMSEWLASCGHNALASGAVLDLVRSLYEHDRRSFPGPVLQDHDGSSTVDLWAYSWHVTHDLKLSPRTGGAIANLSAEEFELATQQVIDASVLAAPSDLRKLRGRTLRLNGRQITDIDAILVVDKTVFLVSCKNFLRKVDYLAGEYAAARSGTSRLNAALDEWHDRVGTLRKAPIGDNYDLSGYKIEGLILLPELMFTPRKDSRDLLRFGANGLFFTRVESFSQFSATLEMASWPPEGRPQSERVAVRRSV